MFCVCSFPAVSWVGLQSVIVVFPGNTHFIIGLNVSLGGWWLHLAELSVALLVFYLAQTSIESKICMIEH